MDHPLSWAIGGSPKAFELRRGGRSEGAHAADSRSPAVLSPLRGFGFFGGRGSPGFTRGYSLSPLQGWGVDAICSGGRWAGESAGELTLGFRRRDRHDRSRVSNLQYALSPLLGLGSLGAGFPGFYPGLLSFALSGINRDWWDWARGSLRVAPSGLGVVGGGVPRVSSGLLSGGLSGLGCGCDVLRRALGRGGLRIVDVGGGHGPPYGLPSAARCGVGGMSAERRTC
jgi:hypothetical protein